jgi:hypothetical protein
VIVSTSFLPCYLAGAINFYNCYVPESRYFRFVSSCDKHQKAEISYLFHLCMVADYVTPWI